MMKNYLAISLFLLVNLLSCGNDDTVASPDPILDDPQLITNTIWETYIDNNFEDLVEASNTQIHFLDHTFISGNHVIYYNSLQNGFVALNRSNGEEVWNNYGELRCSGIRNRPIHYEGALYFICFQDIYKVDINSGNINRFTWVNASETIDDHIAIIDGRLYLQAYPTNQDQISSLWYSSPVDNFNSDSFSSFNPGENILLDSPRHAINNDGHSLLIYTTKVKELCLTVYNLTTETVEWEFCDFGTNNQNSNPIVDADNNIVLIANQNIFKIDLITGQQIYNSEVLSKNFSEVNDALIDTDFEYFYVGQNGSILIDKNTGETLWNVEHYTLTNGNERIVTKGNDTPAVVNNKVYFFDQIQGYLISQDLSNGDLDFHFVNPTKRFGDTSFSGFGNFSNSGKVISEDNILYTSDYFTMLAFPLPE